MSRRLSAPRTASRSRGRIARPASGTKGPAGRPALGSERAPQTLGAETRRGTPTIVEVVEPKPLVTLRGALVLLLCFLVGLVVLGSGARVVWGARLSDECMRDSPDWRLESARRITLFPPGVECVYLNRGDVVRRVRYP